MYSHKEAFALMRYQDEVTGDIEVLWNSRDGVTPFVISSKAGNPASHIDIDRDRCVPTHTPAVGARVFVDLTMERARVQFGLEKAHLYVRIGDLPEPRRSATIDFKGTP